MDRGQEVAGALVVAGRDGPELLQLGKEVLDQVTRLVEILVVRAWVPAVGFGRDHGRLAGPCERREYPRLGVERLVSDQRVGLKPRQQGVRPVEIVRLPWREGEAGRVAQRIDRGVNLRAQAATAAADGFIIAVSFLAAPALC